MRMMPELPIDR